MNTIVTILLLLLIIGIIVTIHEFGHFLAAKKNGVYVDEFCIGMGPKIFGFKRKNDNTDYSIRLFPIGGYVAMASKEGEIDNKKIKKNQILENKSFIQKILILSMGIIFNYILAIVILFLNGLMFGSPNNTPTISLVEDNSPSYIAGLKENDTVLSVNGRKVYTSSDLMVELLAKNVKDSYKLVVKNGSEKRTVNLKPNVTKDEEGNDKLSFGFGITSVKNKGFLNAIKYSFSTAYFTTRNIFYTVVDMIKGEIALDNLSGPVGMYSVVDEVKSVGLESVFYLLAYLSINVGFINFVPIPVFDGGRILLVILEKIFNKKISDKTEEIITLVGFGLLILLTIYITYGDIHDLIVR